MTVISMTSRGNIKNTCCRVVFLITSRMPCFENRQLPFEPVGLANECVKMAFIGIGIWIVGIAEV